MDRQSKRLGGGLGADSPFTLEPNGVLTPEEPEARQALSTRAGTYLLCPTQPDLLCLVRKQPTGQAAEPPRVVLAGDPSGFPLSDLIAFLGQSRWTGVVKVRAPNGERAIFLKEGEVRGATSDDPADRIGEVMVRLGYVTRDRLEEVLLDTPPSKVGRAMVERGIIQSHDLYRCLTELVSDIFHAIILSKEGAFFLVEQEFDDKAIHNLNLSMQSLLMDSIRKIDEMAHFRKRIPHGRMYVVRKRPSDGKLEPEEDHVLGLLSGSRTVLELGQAAKLTEFDVTRIVYRLLEGGYAQVQDKPHGSAAEIAGPVARERPVGAQALSGKDPRSVVQVFNRVFREIRDEVARQHMEREFISAANAALAGQALSSSPVISGLAFDLDGTLPEQRVLDQYARVRPQLGSEPVASLKQALSDVMFFLLFQAGELLESNADEDLARRVKELLARLDGE